jgi:hypothetical protein
MVLGGRRATTQSGLAPEDRTVPHLRLDKGYGRACRDILLVRRFAPSETGSC